MWQISQGHLDSAPVNSDLLKSGRHATSHTNSDYLKGKEYVKKKGGSKSVGLLMNLYAKASKNS